MNPSSSASSSSSTGSSQGGDTPATHIVELTSNTLQVIKVDTGAVIMSRNASLDNKATLELLLNDAASDWQENGWSGAVSSFLPATSWHLVTEEQVRAVGGDATLGALANSLAHGFTGDTVVAGCSAGKGAPVETGGENRWLVGVAPTEALDKILIFTERCKLRPNPIGPGALDHIGAISRLLRVTGQSSVALWELGLDRSHLFLVTVNGVEAVVPCALKLTEVWESIRTELNLKYQLAAARLFYGDLFDFSDAAARIASQLAPALTAAYAALPSQGEKPALACAGLTATQNWLINHLAASLGTTNWQPDPETVLSELGLHVAGDLLPGQLTPSTFGLLHRAAINAQGSVSWKPVWHPASAANFRIALPLAPKPAAPTPAPAPKAPEPVKAAAPTPPPAPKPAPLPAPKPAPIPTPIPAPKAPTPVPRPAQPAPMPTPAPKPVAPVQAPVVKAPTPAPAPAPAVKAPVPTPQPTKPVEAPKVAAPAPVPSKPVEAPKPAAPVPAPAKPAQPAPQPVAKAPTPPPAAPAKAPTPQPAPAAKAPTPAPQPAKPATPQPQPAKAPAPTPTPAKAVTSSSGQPAAKKKFPMGLVLGLAAAVVLGGVAFLFMQQGKANEKAQVALAAQVKAQADADAKVRAAAEAKAAAELKAANEQRDREMQSLRDAAAKAGRDQAKALEDAKAAQEALAHAPGIIKVTSEPDGAEVTVDGATPQVTPAIITNVTPGLRKVIVRLPGFDPVEQLVQLKGTQTVDLGTITLQRLYGELMLRSQPADSEFAVFAAEKPDDPALRTGRTPGRVNNLPPGEYVIKFTRQGLLPTTEHATINGKEIIDVNSTFIVGGVSITSNPSGATVKMNGETLGITPIIRPELVPGRATFEFTLPNHEPQKLSGDISNKETLRLHAEMLHVDRIARKDEVKSPPRILQTANPSFMVEQGNPEGQVVLSVVVTKLGTVRDIRVDKSTNPVLTEPCLKALSQWKFAPAISKAGLPVNMRIAIPFDIKAASPSTEPESTLPIGFRR